MSINGTIVSLKGKPTHRQAHPKSKRSVRVVAVPAFVAEVLRSRIVAIRDEPAEHLLFFSRNGTPLTTANVRRRLRGALKTAGIEGVTPHSFRRTVAMTIERAAGANLAADLLGHTSSDITKEHYVERDGRVNPRTGEILESLAPRPADET